MGELELVWDTVLSWNDFLVGKGRKKGVASGSYTLEGFGRLGIGFL